MPTFEAHAARISRAEEQIGALANAIGNVSARLGTLTDSVTTLSLTMERVERKLDRALGSDAEARPSPLPPLPQRPKRSPF